MGCKADVRKPVGFNRAQCYEEWTRKPTIMRTTQSLSITLPHEMAQMVKAKVSSGEYATESEVIRDGLRTLAARDAAVEKWLLDQVVPTYDRVMADPIANTISAEDAHTRLQAHMNESVKKAASK
jgi:putative addiction module CopG family antidote